jgi:WD40 repeat protein
VTADRRLHVLAADGRELSRRPAGADQVERSLDGTTATIDGKTVVLRTRDGRMTVLRAHRDVVASVDFSPDGRRLVTASLDHDAIVWNVRRGTVEHKLVGHFAEVSDARFSPDGRWIVTAGPGKAGLWEASTGALEYFLQGNEKIVLSAAFDPTSRMIVTGGRDGSVRTWRCTICGHANELLPIARARLAATRG